MTHVVLVEFGMVPFFIVSPPQEVAKECFGIGGSDETFSNEKIPYSGVKECLDVLSPMDAAFRHGNLAGLQMPCNGNGGPDVGLKRCQVAVVDPYQACTGLRRLF